MAPTQEMAVREQCCLGVTQAVYMARTIERHCPMLVLFWGVSVFTPWAVCWVPGAGRGVA
jgi:hypothetical protein